MDWNAFLLGYATGSAQMVLIDLVILVIIWPLRAFIAVLKAPKVRARIKVLLDIPLSPLEALALKEKDP